MAVVANVHPAVMAVKGLKMQYTRLTWDLVSMALKQEPVLQFQKRICLSAVPPPLANMLDCHGHHANAFTAA
jgi:hypothetical protein